MSRVPQIRILQLSDLHFGNHHFTRPKGDASATGIPTLAELLIKDLSSKDWLVSDWSFGDEEVPLIVVITGDLTETADESEYSDVLKFLHNITSKKILGLNVPLERLFLVPGNHDVSFRKCEPEKRLEPYCSFYNKLFDSATEKNRKAVDPHEYSRLNNLYIRTEDNYAIAEINSCAYVQEGTTDSNRGQVDHKTIAFIRRQLQENCDTISSCVRIAIIHHHPVLIPPLFEQDRGYDAIVNSNSLLSLLREYEFHAVLHGHKHYPHVFSFDSECSWSPEEKKLPLIIVAGGSVGSNLLPPGTNASNTYNVITIKWNPDAQQGRMQIVTRGLRRLGPDKPLDPDLWKWETLRICDRIMTPFLTAPMHKSPIVSDFSTLDEESEKMRIEQYENLRGNMPVIEVMPSLRSKQAYEARVWIVPHHENEFPQKVTWSAGRNFKLQICKEESDHNFAATFHYWAPMLVQAALEFKDGTKAYGYVYAHYPTATL